MGYPLSDLFPLLNPTLLPRTHRPHDIHGLVKDPHARSSCTASTERSEQVNTEGCRIGPVTTREAGFLKLPLLRIMQLPRTLILAVLSLTTVTAAAPSAVDYSQGLYVRDTGLHARGNPGGPFGAGAMEPGSPSSSRQGSGSLSSPQRPGSPSTPRRPHSPPALQRAGSDAPPGFVSPPSRFGEYRRPLHKDFRAPGGPVGDSPPQFPLRAGSRSGSFLGGLSTQGSGRLPTQEREPPPPVAALAGPSAVEYPPGYEFHLKCDSHSFAMPNTILNIGATRCEQIMKCHGRTPSLYLGSVEGWIMTLCRQKCWCE